MIIRRVLTHTKIIVVVAVRWRFLLTCRRE